MNLIRYKSWILFSLIIWFIVGSVKLSRRFNQSSTSYRIDLLNSNFDFILKYLSKFNIDLLLIDPFLLDYLFIRQLSFKQYHRPLITFGIFNDSIPIIHRLFSLQNLSIIISQKSSIDHVFIQYNQQIVHLVVLHKKKTYFLIEKNTRTLPMNIKNLTYGDTLRAIEP
jgi:hypothetical protein